MAKIIVALGLLLSATTAGLAQSQSGANFGTPYSGTAGARNGGHYYNYRYARSHHSGGQSARGGGGGIETDPTKPRHLLTVRGVGYRFVAHPGDK